MPKFKVIFSRTVKEWHEAEIEAESADHVQEMLDNGEVATTVFESNIYDESAPQIDLIAR